MAEPGRPSLRATPLSRYAARVMVTLTAAACVGLMLLPIWQSPPAVMFLRLACASLLALLAFSVFELWPKRLPRWVARWALQVLGVAVMLPSSLFLMYVLATDAGEPPFWQVSDRAGGFIIMAATGLLIAPWVALTALVRQKDAVARHQALAFELERSELSRQALDARLRLLQAQIEPHFLFNTLANVHALVASDSPRATAILDSLIQYLRASMPSLQQAQATLGDELTLVRAYLDLMQMRIPDRLTYRVEAEPGALAIACPPMTLMTLVENAVRHGIDPSEEGGSITVHISLRGDRCWAVVADTGLGLRRDGTNGTGLLSLKERLGLTYGDDASLRMEANVPRGTVATIELPWMEA